MCLDAASPVFQQAQHEQLPPDIFLGAAFFAALTALGRLAALRFVAMACLL